MIRRLALAAVGGLALVGARALLDIVVHAWNGDDDLLGLWTPDRSEVFG